MEANEAVHRKGKIREYIEAFAVALFIALFLRTTVVQARVIPSGSMEDTLLVGDYLFINKFVYGYHVPFTEGRILVTQWRTYGTMGPVTTRTSAVGAAASPASFFVGSRSNLVLPGSISAAIAHRDTLPSPANRRPDTS